MIAAVNPSRAAPVSTYTRQGWVFVALGARDAAAKRISISARGTGVGKNPRTLRLPAMADSTGLTTASSISIPHNRFARTIPPSQANHNKTGRGATSTSPHHVPSLKARDQPGSSTLFTTWITPFD